MDRHPQPPSTNSSTGGNNLPPGIGARTVVRRRSGGKHFSRTVNNNAPNPTREELHNGPSRKVLPKEVQEMDRQDTVCKFCGVSYLVFSEIKELEKRLEDSESKIQQYSKRLKDFDKLRRQLERLQETQKTAQKNQLAILEEEWIARTNALSAKVEMLEAECRTHRLKGNKAKLFMDKQRRKLGALKQALKREKDALRSIRNDAGASIKDMGLLMQSAMNEVEVMSVRLKKEIEAREKGDELRKTLKGQIEILEEEWKSDVRRLEEQLQVQKKQVEDKCAQNMKTAETAHQAEVKAMQDRLDEEAKQAKLLREELRNMEVKAKKLGMTHDEKHGKLVSNLMELQGKFDMQEKNILSLQHQIESLKLELEKAKKELKEVKDRNTTLGRESTRLKNDLLIEKSASKSTIQKLEKFLNTANDEIKILQENSKVIKEKHAQELDIANHKLEEALSNLETTKQEFDTYKHLHENDKSLATEMQEKLDAAKAEYRSQLERLKHQHKMEITELKEDCEGRIMQVKASFKEEINQCQKEKLEAQKKCHDLDEENQKLLQNLENEKNRFAALMDQVKALNLQVSQNANKLEIVEQEKLELKKNAKSKEWEIERLRAEMEEMKGNNQKETSDGLEMLERHLIKLSEKIRKKDQEIGNLEATVHRQCRERQGLLDELKKYRRGTA